MRTGDQIEGGYTIRSNLNFQVGSAGNGNEVAGSLLPLYISYPDIDIRYHPAGRAHPFVING